MPHDAPLSKSARRGPLPGRGRRPRVLFAVLAAILLTPALAGPASSQGDEDPPRERVHATQPVPFPEWYLEAAADWIAQAEADGQAYENRDWWANATIPLSKARDALEDGRARSALVHLSNHYTLVQFFLVLDDIETLTSNTTKRPRVLSVTDFARDEAKEARDAFREDLRAYEDGHLASLHTFERAFYAVLLVNEAESAMDSYETLRNAFLGEPGVEPGYVFSLVSGSEGPLRVIRFAQDIFDRAKAEEGTEPLVDLEDLARNAANFSKVPRGTKPIYTIHHFQRLNESHEREENVYALGTWSTIRRLQRIHDIGFMFSNAQNRGLNASGDLLRNLDRDIPNATAAPFTEIGYTSLLAADAVDRALWARETGESNIPVLADGWGALDFKTTGILTLLKVLSPVEAPPAETQEEKDPVETPGPAAAVAVGALAGAALLLVAAGRERRRR